jgi:hypothetical protein
MWRGAIALVLVALFHLGVAHAAATIHCSGSNQVNLVDGTNALSSVVMDGVSKPIGTWRRQATTTINWTLFGQAVLFSDSGGQLVEPGAPCPSNTTGVLMSKGDYDVITNAANVVTKLSELSDMAVVGIISLACLAGFWFAFRIFGAKGDAS